MHSYMADEKLRKQERLLRSAQFEAVFDARLSAGNKWLTLHWRDNGLGHPRLGLVVSRKFGNAVARNRFKRRIREFFRRNKSMADSLDLVVLPARGAGAANATFEETRDAFLKLLRAASERQGHARV